MHDEAGAGEPIYLEFADALALYAAIIDATPKVRVCTARGVPRESSGGTLWKVLLDTATTLGPAAGFSRSLLSDFADIR